MSMYDTEPESCDPGHLREPEPTPFRCLDCAWTGKGYQAQADHWRVSGHQIVWAHDPRPTEIRQVG